MYKIAGASLIAMACISKPAIASEEVIYSKAPSWVEPVQIDAAIATNEELVLLDRQIRAEAGTVHQYSDVAYKIENPDSLTKLGTIKLSWLPDKGDLIVHWLEIIREGATIDLLTQGTRYDILRRERQLEERSLDGSLTATVAADEPRRNPR